MNDWGQSGCLDIPFTVPFVHRLRFTTDILAREPHVLAEVLEPSGRQPARVQVWLDAQLAAVRPDLPGRLHAVLNSYPERFSLTGPIQLAPGGEAVKNDIHLLEDMLKVFEAADLDRRSYVIVIGGGAVLDAVGFAAAIAHRGLRLVR